jgi:hypothetical protein
LDIIAPLQRPVLVRTITTNEFPELPLDIPIAPLQRCTNNEYRLSPSQLERYRVADSEEKAALLATLIPIEPAFSGLPRRIPITAEEVEEIVQGFRKAF